MVRGEDRAPCRWERGHEAPIHLPIGESEAQARAREPGARPATSPGRVGSNSIKLRRQSPIRVARTHLLVTRDPRVPLKYAELQTSFEIQTFDRPVAKLGKRKCSAFWLDEIGTHNSNVKCKQSQGSGM